MVDFSGRATCDECRPKKRKQCAALVVSRAETLATLKVENEKLQKTVSNQAEENQRMKTVMDQQATDIARYRKHVDALEEQLKASGVEPQLMIEESRPEPQPPSPTPGTPPEDSKVESPVKQERPHADQASDQPAEPIEPAEQPAEHPQTDLLDCPFDIATTLGSTFPESGQGSGIGVRERRSSSDCSDKLEVVTPGSSSSRSSTPPHHPGSSSSAQEPLIETILAGVSITNAPYIAHKLLFAALGLCPFDPSTEAAYNAHRAKERALGLSLMIFLYLPMLFALHIGHYWEMAQFPEAVLLLLPMAQPEANAILGWHSWVVCYMTISCIAIQPTLWLRRRGLPFIMRHGQWVLFFGVMTSAIANFCSSVAILTEQRITEMTTSEAINQAVIHMLLRPLAGKVIADLPVWWIGLMLLMKWVGIWYLAPSLYSSCIDGIGIIGPCMLVFVISVMWIEYTRRAQFLDALRMYNHGADKQFDHMSSNVKIKHELLRDDSAFSLRK